MPPLIYNSNRPIKWKDFDAVEKYIISVFFLIPYAIGAISVLFFTEKLTLVGKALCILVMPVAWAFGWVEGIAFFAKFGMAQ